MSKANKSLLRGNQTEHTRWKGAQNKNWMAFQETIHGLLYSYPTFFKQRLANEVERGMEWQRGND
jgi:hypothetical protein